jgi:hypothetical protein
MTYTPIPKGTPNWDVPLNNALSQLDNNITSGITNALQAANNLSDLTSAAQARNNLGITAGAAQGVNQFNVKDYGAIGNGVANDVTAIQNAINAASPTGGIVFFPPGDYLINSGTGLTIGTAAVMLMGAGAEASSLVVGGSFAGTSLLSFTANDCAVRDISVDGANQSSTTSNPVAHAVTVTGAQNFRVSNATFTRINGYCVRAIGTASQTLHGGMIHNVKMQSSAGGIYIISDSTNTAANFMLSNVFTRFMGVASGGSANLDCIHVEDSWDVLMQNVMPWMQATLGGTGAALRVKGNCAATFIQNLDALGPQTGTNVVIESGPNGDPQNVQIQGGVIQQGNVGLSITGASTQIRVRNVRIISNQTHGISVAGTASAIYLDECFFSLNGAGATGTNYDVNWSGTSTGHITDCRFGSNIVTVGTAGVQFSINVALAQNVRVLNADFQGTGNNSTNWFTNVPSIAMETSNGKLDYLTTITANNGTRPIESQPSAAGNTALAVNVSGNDANDRLRILGNGTYNIGPGTAARDTTMGRAASGILYTDKNMLIGSATALGDNGVGEIQLANATTVPTTNPTGGAVIYASSTGAPVKLRDTTGKIRGLTKMTAVQTSTQASVGTAQTASTSLTLAVEANATYLVQAWVYWTTASSATVTTSWTGPAGTTFVWNDTTTGGDVVTTLTGVSPIWPTGNKMVNLFGTLTTTGTAGTLTFTWASSVTGGTVVTQPQSTLTLERIA